MRMLIGFLTAVCAVGLCPLDVQAGKFNDSVFLFERNHGSLVNFERHIDNGAPNGVFDVGDSLRGIINIISIQNSTSTLSNAVGSDPNAEITGIFSLIVTSITPLFGSVVAFTFGPDPAFAAEFGLPAGTMIALFEEDLTQGGAMPFDGTSGTIAAAEATATGGDLVVALGFGPGVFGTDFFWTAFGDIDPSAIGTSTFTAGLNVLQNNSGLSFVDIQHPGPIGAGVIVGVPFFSEFALIGNVSGNLQGGPFPLQSSDPVDFLPIPEPGTLTIFGLSLAMAGVICVRRRRRTAA